MSMESPSFVFLKKSHSKQEADPSPVTNLSKKFDKLFQSEDSQDSHPVDSFSFTALTDDECSNDSGFDQEETDSPFLMSMPTSFRDLFTKEIHSESPKLTQSRRVLFAADDTSPQAHNIKSSPMLKVPPPYKQSPKNHALKRKLYQSDDRNATVDISTSKNKRLKLDHCDIQENIKGVLEKRDLESNLVGDGSRKHRLPTVTGKQQDLQYISPSTMVDLLTGRIHLDENTDYKVIDCRYPFEYEGGHISGALNLHSQEKLTKFLKEFHSCTDTKDTILIFHCEFSSERGPKRARFMRDLDRQLNAEKYPYLNFPEIYIIADGYKAFFEQHSELCTPQGYTPMLHEAHRNDMKKFRSKSKSWSAGDKTSPAKKLPQMKLQLDFDI